MDYEYAITLINSTSGINISSGEFDSIRRALLGLHQALGLEEKFDIVMEDYAELEAELLKGAALNIYFSDPSWNSKASFQEKLNRLLLHLLSSVRMYRDHSRSNFSEIFGRSSQERQDLIESEKKECRDIFAYRVLEQLRNYSQHRNLPIDNIQYKYLRLDSALSTHTIELVIDINRLEDDRDFKEILKEWKESEQEWKKSVMEIPGKNYFPLKPLIRDYISSVSRIHRHVRESLKPKIEEWETTVEFAVAKVRESFGEDEIPLSEIARINLEDGQHRDVIERHFLAVDEIIKRRKRLERKNGQLHNMSLNRISITGA